MSKARSPRASCSMTIGTSGMAVSLLIVGGRPPAGLLAAARAPLLLEPALLRRLRRLGRSPRTRNPQRAVEPLRQPLQREHPVASLPARLLRHGRHARAEPRHHAALLLVAERGGGRHVEDGLHARSGDVGVLPARSGGATGPNCDLGV